MLEHRLHPDAVKHPVIKGQPVGIGHQRGMRRGVDVGADKFDRAVAVKFVGAGANGAAANDEDDRPLGLLLQKIDEFRTI